MINTVVAILLMVLWLGVGFIVGVVFARKKLERQLQELLVSLLSSTTKEKNES